MKLTARTLVLIAVVFAVIGGETRAHAQRLADFTLEPSLSDLGCNEMYCIIDASQSSRLFIYIPLKAQLWVYPSDGSPAEMIDMSSRSADIGLVSIMLDFVAISDTELLFFGQHAHIGNGLRIFDLNTNQVREPAIDFGDIYLTECDGYPAYPIDNLYRVPNSSHILLCSILDGIRRFVIVDFETEQVVQVIDFPGRLPNPYLLPWRKLLVGQDGSIYVHGLFADTVEALFPDDLEAIWGNGQITIAKYDVSSQAWSVVELSVDLIQTNLSTGEFIGIGSINELAAVDAVGNLYYWNSAWQYEAEGGPETSKHVPLLTVFDYSGQLVTQLPPNAFPDGGHPVFRYESISGELVFTVQSPPGLFAIHPSEILSMPTPDSTPALP